jgi:hypothetical protein
VETHGRDCQMMRRDRGGARCWRGGLVAALALVSLLVAGCTVSGGGDGINYSLGLQGATDDHPATPPKVAATGPNREYAFVYDNQIWVRQKDASQPRQVTQLTLSAGADIIWGPLVWSSSGRSLAFALVVNLTPNNPASAAGPIYYVDLSKCLSSASTACATYHTPLTGNVYGHTYAWYDDDLLITGGGGGISAYDLHDPNGPRVWQLRTTMNERQDSDCLQPSSYGDVQVSGTQLYYTCMTLPGLGKTGQIGSATLNWLSLAPFANAFTMIDQVARDQYIATVQNNDQFYGMWFASLGNVYSDPQGNPVAGAWRIGGNTVAYEMIGSVDAKAKVASRTICVAFTWNGYCNQQTLSSVGKQPLAVHAQISVGPGGAVAYQGAQLYATKLSKALETTSMYAPQWASGDTLLVTSVLSTTTDAAGVTRQTTSVQIANGDALTALISGASDLALH